MNIGEKVTILHFNEGVRLVKKGDLFRVIEVKGEINPVITLAAIDEACLRDDEIGARRKEKKKPKKPKKPSRTLAQQRMDIRARKAWKKQSVMECLAAIDKEEEE